MSLEGTGLSPKDLIDTVVSRLIEADYADEVVIVSMVNSAIDLKANGCPFVRVSSTED
jgi:hypothetical protein